MKVIELVKNADLRCVEYQKKDPLEDECQIAINYAGICSSDIYRSYYSGAYFYPLVMGHEFSGTVELCGKKAAKKFKRGDRVSVFPLIPCKKCQACQK